MGTVGNHRRRAVFLDRDGVINRNVLNPATGEFESPLTPDDFELLPGTLDALLALRSAGLLLFLVSNQPNIAKGKSTPEQLESIHQKLLSALTQAQIQFARFYYCFHHPQGVVSGYSGPCECRKPSPHFLLKAAREFNLDLSSSWMIGDRLTDVQCGKAAGARTIFIHPAQSQPGTAIQPDSFAPDLETAAQQILSTG
jgi:D-glycero-D-manno-heptose 1,7-bisphosphate phosphatase